MSVSVIGVSPSYKQLQHIPGSVAQDLGCFRRTAVILLTYQQVSVFEFIIYGLFLLVIRVVAAD